MDSAREIQSVLDVAARLVGAFSTHDTKRYFDHFDSNCSFLFYNMDRVLGSLAEYEQEWKNWEDADGFKVLRCDSSNRSVSVFGDTAILTHEVETEISTNAGPRTNFERETIVFRKFDGDWIAIHEHLSERPA